MKVIFALDVYIFNRMMLWKGLSWLATRRGYVPCNEDTLVLRERSSLEYIILRAKTVGWWRGWVGDAAAEWCLNVGHPRSKLCSRMTLNLNENQGWWKNSLLKIQIILSPHREKITPFLQSGLSEYFYPFPSVSINIPLMILKNVLRSTKSNIHLTYRWRSSALTAWFCHLQRLFTSP